MTTYSSTRILFDTVGPLSVPMDRIDTHRCRSRCPSFLPEFMLERGAGVGAESAPGIPITTYIGAAHALRSACCRANKNSKTTRSACLHTRNTKCKDV